MFMIDVHPYLDLARKTHLSAIKTGNCYIGRRRHQLGSLTLPKLLPTNSVQTMHAKVKERGKVKLKDKLHFKESGEDYEVLKLAVHEPFYSEVKELGAGEVGVIICGIKTVRDVKILFVH